MNCSDNQLTSLDVSNNTNLRLGVNLGLQKSSGSNQQLISPDVSSRTNYVPYWLISGLNCSNNLLTSLDVSNNLNLEGLDCFGNQLTSLDVSSNTALAGLNCSDNQLTSLDVSSNPNLIFISLGEMTNLTQVCVWIMPFPPEDVFPELEIEIDMNGSPNVYFTTECSDIESPILIAVDSLYQADYIEATSSEDGVIYIVPKDTDTHLGLIRGLCIDSVVVVSNTPANISLSGLENGTYWLYATDSTGNISDPKAITIMGVGIQQSKAGFIRLYPNPTNTLLTIETKYSDHYSIEITSLNGQEIYTAEMQGSSRQIDLSSYQKGVYFITIKSEDFVSTRKFIRL